jgi:hypothetical protein
MNKNKTKFTKKDVMKNFTMHEAGAWDNAWIEVRSVDNKGVRIHNIGLSFTITIDNKFNSGTFLSR